MKDKIFKVLMAFIVVLLIGCCSVIFISKKEMWEAKKESEATYKKYGYVDKITVEDSVDYYIKQLSSNMLEYEVVGKTPTINKKTYWYPINNYISIYVDPVEYSENASKDITKNIGLYIDKTYTNQELIMSYVVGLIKSNNEKLTTGQINDLINKAKASNSKFIFSGKGLKLAIIDENDSYQYQIERIYK